MLFGSWLGDRGSVCATPKELKVSSAKLCAELWREGNCKQSFNIVLAFGTATTAIKDSNLESEVTAGKSTK